jgi:hypothetical protein
MSRIMHMDAQLATFNRDFYFPGARPRKRVINTAFTLIAQIGAKRRFRPRERL